MAKRGQIKSDNRHPTWGDPKMDSRNEVKLEELVDEPLYGVKTTVQVFTLVGKTFKDSSPSPPTISRAKRREARLSVHLV